MGADLYKHQVPNKTGTFGLTEIKGIITELEIILGPAEMTTYQKDNIMQRLDFNYRGKVIDLTELTEEQLQKSDGITVELYSIQNPGRYITLSYSKAAPKNIWIYGMRLEEEQKQEISQKFRQKGISEIVMNLFRKKQAV